MPRHFDFYRRGVRLNPRLEAAPLSPEPGARQVAPLTPELPPEYQELLRQIEQEPVRPAPMPTPGRGRRLLNSAAVGLAAGMYGPEAGLAYRERLESPNPRDVRLAAEENAFRQQAINSKVAALRLRKELTPEPEESFTLSPGQERYEGGKKIAGVSPLPEKPSTAGRGRTITTRGRIMQLNTETGEYDIDAGPAEPKLPGRDFQAEQEAQRRFQAEQNALNRANREEAARIAAGAKPATAAALRVATFYYRMKDSIDSIERSPGAGIKSLEQEISKLGTLGQIGLEILPNLLQSQVGQLYRQAQRQFTEARLRKDSGAAIRDEEYEQDAKIYFAVPGDTKETLARKQQAREVALNAIRREAGKAVESEPEGTKKRLVEGVDF